MTPKEEFLFYHSRFFSSGHFHQHYTEWRMRRIRKTLTVFPPEFFVNKRVFELGGAWKYWRIFC